ncbi:MAG: TetR/AcrR family transcriptional regulator [Spirochaetales bacterium]|nr:TetR/AcrR family transcriptional regulator [Spirochaetales bacterium]
MTDDILHAAIRCFSRNGFHKTSINDITRELGASKGSIYYYFKNKSEIIYKVVEKGVSAINECITLELSKEQSLADLMRRVVTSFVEMSFSFPELIRVAYGEENRGLDEELTVGIRRLKSTTVQLVASNLSAGAEIHVVKEGLDYDLVASSVIAMMGAACIENGQKEEPKSKSEMVRHLVALVSTGIFSEDKSQAPESFHW